ncbi:putative leucine-rich repeat-containing protein DDB_G0290503 [Anoplopoma fimbria]|uniref:putative leucine-rich repeat-containing protein DDB_G0290503 n=1 Tax=Anoplopoma fimbria TaxID=229290 RepID=UPI0023EDFBC3|nr:putative leucine-rich repeat-containing protein DDB_G0290503 [Anoplopoma fimbria]
MKEVRELDVDKQHQTTSTSQTTTLQTLLQVKERELAKAQAVINELQKKLWIKSKQCFGLEERYEEVKTEFEQKIAELNRTGDSKAALILNVINLHEDLKTLRDLISTTEDPDRISELKRQLEEKQEELMSKSAHIERLIAHPTTILTIIELQNEIWDLEKKVANETTGGRIEELQNRVDGLLTEIEDRDDDNTKLILIIMTLQSQVERLKRQLSDHQMFQTPLVAQLTNDLTTKKNELQEYINELNEKNQANAQLNLQRQLEQSQEDAVLLQQQLDEKDATINS